jgi:hypothetical protein
MGSAAESVRPDGLGDERTVWAGILRVYQTSLHVDGRQWK